MMMSLSLGQRFIRVFIQLCNPLTKKKRKIHSRHYGCHLSRCLRRTSGHLWCYRSVVTVPPSEGQQINVWQQIHSVIRVVWWSIKFKWLMSILFVRARQFWWSNYFLCCQPQIEIFQNVFSFIILDVFSVICYILFHTIYYTCNRYGLI